MNKHSYPHTCPHCKADVAVIFEFVFPPTSGTFFDYDCPSCGETVRFAPLGGAYTEVTQSSSLRNQAVARPSAA